MKSMACQLSIIHLCEFISSLCFAKVDREKGKGEETFVKIMLKKAQQIFYPFSFHFYQMHFKAMI